MANMNKEKANMVAAWCERARMFLDESPIWRSEQRGSDAFVITYKGKEYTVTVFDLGQLASDLGIFHKMYPEPTNVGKTTKWDDLVQPAQPETFVVFNADNDMWFLTVMDVTFCVCGEIAGKMLNAGCEYRKYQPR